MSPSGARRRSKPRVSRKWSTTPGGSTALPVLVASGYVVARRSSDVGVKMGGRLARLRFEEGTRVRKGEVIAEIEHADIDAQLEASRRAVAEGEAQLGQALATRDEDLRNLDRQRALMKDGITTTATLTAAEASAAVSAARVKSAEAAIASARARVRVTEEAIENANVRAPFDGVVIKKRAEVGETVSPFGVAGPGVARGRRDCDHRRPRRARGADRSQREQRGEAERRRCRPRSRSRRTRISPTRAGCGRFFRPPIGRRRSSKSVSLFSIPTPHVKPEMTASVTFQEPGAGRGRSGAATESGPPAAGAAGGARAQARHQPAGRHVGRLGRQQRLVRAPRRDARRRAASIRSKSGAASSRARWSC